MEKHRSAFAQWLDDIMRARGVSNTKLAAAPGVNKTATAVVKWRTGENVPHETAVIDAIANFFGEDPGKIRLYAGRAGLGTEIPGVNPEIEGLARAIQAELEAITNPHHREYRRQELMRLYQFWRDDNEAFFEFWDNEMKTGGDNDGR